MRKKPPKPKPESHIRLSWNAKGSLSLVPPAPKTSWWANKPREAFTEEAAKQAPRMRLGLTDNARIHE